MGPSRRLQDDVLDRRTFKRIIGITEDRGGFRRRNALRQFLPFAAFHMHQDGRLVELKRLEYLYGEQFYAKAGATAEQLRERGRKRLYEHIAMAEEAGYLRQIQWPANNGQRAVYRAAMRPDALPQGLPLDLAMHLQIEERWRDPEAGLEPLPVPDRPRPAPTGPPAPRTPVEITDRVAAARARYLTVEPWISDLYLVAAAMRVDRQDAEAAGREFDEAAAEARARARLQLDDGSADYEVIPETELQAVAVEQAGSAPKTPAVQLILNNPDTLPYSREGSLPLRSLTHHWLDLRKQEKSKTERPPSGAHLFEVGPTERRRAGALIRDYIYWAWQAWWQENPAERGQLTEGQWYDLTCTVALALRRMSPAEVIEECTRSLGTARRLAPVVASRLWARVRAEEEGPEWAEWRRDLMAGAEPGGWTLPTPPGVIGPASAHAAARRARGGVERIGTQLELAGLTRLPAADPGGRATEVRQAIGTAAMDTGRYRYGQVIPDTARIGIWELETAVALQAAQAAAAVRQSAEQLQDEQAAAAAYRAQRDAERPAVHAAAAARARAERRAREKR